MLRQYQKKIKNFIKESDEIAYRLKYFSLRIAGFASKYIDDKNYIESQYKRKTRKKLNLDNPILFNEKIQWLKLNYREPLMNLCVDKYEVRKYVRNKIGNADSILIPLIGVYEDVNDIDFSSLPNSFILKLTNGSSFNYICLNKDYKELRKIKSRFIKWQDLNYYDIGREWAYKDVKNRIICEKLLTTTSGNPPADYRFFCFGGKVKVIAIDIESVIGGMKNSNYYRNLYTSEWDKINATIEYPNKPNYDVPKPKRLEEMINIAEKLSEDFPAVRVDLYYFDEQIYFSELTFYHASGYQNIQPQSFEKQMGDWIEIY